MSELLKKENNDIDLSKIPVGFEYLARLSNAYKRILEETPSYFAEGLQFAKKEKGIFRVREFESPTPRHNRTNRSFEENEQHLRQLDNEPIWKLETGPVLTKKLTPPKNIRNK